MVRRVCPCVQQLTVVRRRERLLHAAVRTLYDAQHCVVSHTIAVGKHDTGC